MLHDIIDLKFDATKTAGKVWLLLLVMFLSWFFNWDMVWKRAFLSMENFIRDIPAFSHVKEKSADATPTPLEKLLQIDKALTFHSSIVRAKIEHPFGQVDLSTDVSGHFEKLAFRFMPFLIAHVLHLDHSGLFFLQILLGFIFPFLIWKLLHNATKSVSVATAGVVLITGLYAGFAFFSDVIFFDSIAYFFIACGMLRFPRWVSVIFLLCAAFTDERAVPAAGMVPLWHLLTARETINWRHIIKESAWLMGFVALYVILRLTIGALTGLETGHRSVGMEMLIKNMTNITLLVWSVFEGGWIIVVLASFQLYDDKSLPVRFIAVAAAACFACIFLLGLLVGDSIRSQQYAFPLLLIALAVAGRANGGIPNRLLWLAIILTMMTPISYYLSWEIVNGRTVYNMAPMKPGYLRLFGM